MPGFKKDEIDITLENQTLTISAFFTRAQLLDAVAGDDSEAFERAIDAHVKNIRRKLERDSRKPRYLLTVYGVGYKVADQ